MRYALWNEKISVKWSINTSYFHLVYGKEVILPIYLGLHVLKLIQHETEEPNNMVGRIYDLIGIQQEIKMVSEKLIEHKKNQKYLCHKRIGKILPSMRPSSEVGC